MEDTNILLQDWEFPPFGDISIADYEPAISVAIQEEEANVELIATNPIEPTFANTIEALEVADKRLSHISAILTNLNECCTNDELQQLVLRIEPEITKLANKISTDERLFHRVEEVRNSDASTIRSDDEKMLLERSYKSFVRHGVALHGEARDEYRNNEEELSRLKLQFGQNALADLNSFKLHITDPADLDGLPQSVRDSAETDDGWVFDLSFPSYGPFMTYSRRRNLREKMYRAYMSIGNRGNEHDNNAIIHRIVELRHRQANLLGYDTYCDYVLCDRMVGSLPNLLSFMQRLRDDVLPAARCDIDTLKTMAGGDFMPWDLSFYSEQLKQQRFSFDSEQLRPYFELENVKRGIFSLYGRLYGLIFIEDSSIPVYHPDVTVYRVSRGAKEMGILYLDMHPRPSKRSGAWMTEFRGQYIEQPTTNSEQLMTDVRPQIQIVCNFSKPTASGLPSTASKPVALLRFSEFETFMHEMGHAMHSMLSEVRYESLSGTNVLRDFVEMPSQVMENWCYEPGFLNTFARHYQTGEPIPIEYIEKIRAAQNHMAGWLCLRQLNLGFTDIAFHAASSSEGRRTAEDVEREAMTDLFPRIEGCCTATNFSHIFGGGYASGYYGYKWAEVLDADIFSRFRHDGIFNTATAESFRKEILARGGTVKPDQLFRNFMGRDPDESALIHRMDLTQGGF